MKVEIPYEDRSKHIYVPGSSGFGKSTTLEHMIFQDICNGAGICVLDPKGDMVERIVQLVPENRKNDVWYIDIADPIPIDFMSWRNERQKQSLIGDLYQIFLSFSTMTAGDQWLSILRKTIQTIVEARNCSFMDIEKILINEKYRDEVVARTGNSELKDYWQNQFQRLKSPREDPILTRMSPFTTSESLKTLLGSPTGLNLLHVMQNRNILLVNLGSLTKEFGNLIGKLFVSRIQQLAFSRGLHERIPFFLYADEFQNFQTSAFDTILSEARSYNLCLTLANQGLYQLDPDIRSSIFANVNGAWIMLRVDAADARFYQTKIKPYDCENLSDSWPGHAYVKVGAAPARSVFIDPPLDIPHPNFAEYIKKRTKDMHSCNTVRSPHTESNVTKSDNIEAGGRPAPPNKSKKRGA